jgi:hypothetical protein
MLSSSPALPVDMTTRLQDGVESARRSGWWVVAAIAVVVNVAVTVKVGVTAVEPEFPFDELHLLQLARLLAGDPVPDFGSAGYFPLWGIVLTPLWWISDDPGTVYRAAAVVGLVVGVATIWPLALVVRRVGLSLPQSLTVAAVVMTLPARAIQADYVLSERLLFLCVTLATLAAFRLWERTTMLRAVVFGLAVSAAYLTHVRMITLVLASAIWLLALLLKRWSVALVGLVTLAAGYFGADWLGGHLNELLTGAAPSQSDGFMASLQDFHLSNFVRLALSQTWAQLVGSFGLVAVGFVAVVMWSWAEVRHGRLGRACWVFGVLVATFLVSALAWSNTEDLWNDGWRRLDPWVYTRYLDPVSGIVVALGLAVLVAGVVRTRTWAWAAGGTAVVVAAVLAVVAPVAPTWGYITPAHIPGVLPWEWAFPDARFDAPVFSTFTNANRFWLWASVTCLACFLLVLLLRRWTRVVVAGALVVAALGTLVADRASDTFRAGQGIDPASVVGLERFLDEHDVDTVGWDFSCNRDMLSRGAGLNYVGYELEPDAIVERVDSAWDDDPDLDVVVSCWGGTRLQDSGALHLPGYEVYGAWVWIMPGALQDSLLADGELTPAPAG